ncbi:uncharacterized protein LOC114543748 isoform X2 [Dendronephthya gigantea]|uniref:uncharacterized protein LOC114543748 isoform X2 n=1 Tax=Dendronephthya gigantea TaxID=151771 RepID=UPI00106C00BE|nr:uncharacterized protein LOC114543748 isoform X2 [Dendronephthya gigantea]
MHQISADQLHCPGLPFIQVGRVFNNAVNPEDLQSCNLGNHGPTVKVSEGRYRLVYDTLEEFLVGKRQTDVYLEYDGLSEGRTSSMERYGGFFKMTLFTKYAPRRSASKIKKKANDDDSLSIGTVILIIVFCLTALYIGIGVPYMKFVRGARGREIIPHYSYWSEIPSLAKDGCSYTLQAIQGCASSTCANISTRKDYERI